MLASLLILGAPLAWAGRTWRFIIVLVLDVFLTVLLMSDRIHHRFFGDILSVAELPHAWQIGAVTSGIFDKMQIADALFYVDVLIALAALPFYIRILSRIASNRSPSTDPCGFLVDIFRPACLNTNDSSCIPRPGFGFQLACGETPDCRSHRVPPLSCFGFRDICPDLLGQYSCDRATA